MREFTFDRYEETPGNQLAFKRAKAFDSLRENLYLWGPCGVGKTHLAYAIAREAFERSHTAVEILTPPKLSRKVRMKEPDDEQNVIDRLVDMELLILDDLGMGSDTAYFRQILQEILDGRNFHERGGLVITSKYSLTSLAQKLDEDTLPSRLAGMCSVIEVHGIDGRLQERRIV